MCAEQLGYPDIAAFMRRYELFQRSHDEEQVIREVCEIPAHQELTKIGLAGLQRRMVMDQKVFAHVMASDKPLLRMFITPQDTVTRYEWYGCYVPQIIQRSLAWTAFREGKPLHELGTRSAWPVKTTKGWAWIKSLLDADKFINAGSRMRRLRSSS